MRILLCCAAACALALVGCEDPAPASPRAPEAAAVEPPPVVPRHRYAMRDGDQYGYEPALSQSAQMAGQAGSALVMLSYLGERGGKHQLMLKKGGAVGVFECANPCDFFRVMTFAGGYPMGTERMRAVPELIASAAMRDAIDGYLEPATKTVGGKRVRMWFDEQKGVQYFAP